MTPLSRKGTREISIKVTDSRVDPEIMCGTFCRSWNGEGEISSQ